MLFIYNLRKSAVWAEKMSFFFLSYRTSLFSPFRSTSEEKGRQSKLDLTDFSIQGFLKHNDIFFSNSIKRRQFNLFYCLLNWCYFPQNIALLFILYDATMNFLKSSCNPFNCSYTVHAYREWVQYSNIHQTLLSISDWFEAAMLLYPVFSYACGFRIA